MKRAMRLNAVLCLALGLFIAGPAYAGKKPDFKEIVHKFIEKGEADSLYMGDNYTHEEWEITENIKNGVVAEIEQKSYQVEKRGKDLYKRLTAKNGVSVFGSEFQKKPPLVEIGIKLLSKYDFSFEREETAKEEKCWVFSFRPKNDLAESSGKENAENRLAGEIWIAKETLTFKKLTAQLLSDANISLKFKGMGMGNLRIQKLDLLVTAGLIDGHFAVDYAQAEYIYTVKLFHYFPVFNDKHETKKINYENYERRKP